MSARMPASDPPIPSAAPSITGNSTVNRKVEPCPSVLSTVRLPPIRPTICLEIASPRPVPP